MNNEINQRMVQLLDNEPSLRIFWAEPPEAMLMPFMRSREEFFASVSLLLVPSAFNLETLTFIVTSSVALLNRSELLEGLRGVEVRLFIREGGQAVKLMRFSVREAGLENASRLGNSDFLKEKPIADVTCGWYVSPPAG